MLRDKNLAVNTALLTASGLFMRFVGMIWQIWLVGRIGEAGIGLFQLVMSVGTLAAAVAVSGSRYTAVRLVSEETGIDNPSGAAEAMGVCMLYGLFFGLAAGLALMFLAEPLGFLWLNDARTVRPLLLLALEMPLTGLDAVMHGYFTAVGRVWKSVAAGICQQLAAIAGTALLLTGSTGGNLEYSCLAIMAGRLLGAAAEIVFITILYVSDRRAHGIRRKIARSSLAGMVNRALSIALPLAGASYARSGLSTLQHLMVPVGLRASGLAAETALADYGVIQGMALPVVLFPSCVMVAVAELIVPKLTERQVRGDDAGIRAVTGRIMRGGLFFSAICTAVLAALGDPLGIALFTTPAAGKYIRLFALIIPVMYLDMLADGCLKGLGQMMFCMVVNIADAGLSALMVWLLLPRYGLTAYLVTICFTELFNFLLSYGRLRRLTGLRLFDLQAVKIFLCAGLAAGGGRLVYDVISAGNGVPALILSVIVSLVLYALAISPGAGAGRPASG